MRAGCLMLCCDVVVNVVVDVVVLCVVLCAYVLLLCPPFRSVTHTVRKK